MGKSPVFSIVMSLVLVFNSFFVYVPETQAQTGPLEPVEAVGELLATCFGVAAVSNVTASISSFLDPLQVAVSDKGSSLGKECALDGAAVSIADALFNAFLQDIANWARSGFDGKPLFLSNRNAFLRNAGNYLIDELLRSDDALGQIVGALCEGIRFDVRFELGIIGGNARPNFTCTIDDIERRWDTFENDLGQFSDIEDLILFNSTDNVIAPFEIAQQVLDEVRNLRDTLDEATEGGAIADYDERCVANLKNTNEYKDYLKLTELSLVEQARGQPAKDAYLLALAEEYCAKVRTAEEVESTAKDAKDQERTRIFESDEFQDVIQLLISAFLEGGIKRLRDGLRDDRGGGFGGIPVASTPTRTSSSGLNSTQTSALNVISSTVNAVNLHANREVLLAQDREIMYVGLSFINEGNFPEYSNYLDRCSSAPKTSIENFIGELMNDNVIDLTDRITVSETDTSETILAKRNSTRSEILGNIEKTISEERNKESVIHDEFNSNLKKFREARDVVITQIKSATTNDDTTNERINTLRRDFQATSESLFPNYLTSTSHTTKLAANDKFYNKLQTLLTSIQTDTNQGFTNSSCDEIAKSLRDRVQQSRDSVNGFLQVNTVLPNYISAFNFRLNSLK